jgi:putative DNA primase/helicase
MTVPVLTAATVTPRTEAGAAERFAHAYGDTWRYDHQRGRWLYWSGHLWTPDRDERLTRDLITFARVWQHDIVESGLSGSDKDDALRFARSLETRTRQLAVTALARALPPLADAGDQWDAIPHLLGTPSGVIDLRTGLRRDGCRADRMTMQTGIDFEADANPVRWDMALLEILPNPEVRTYFQLAAGYSTTGETARDCWFLAQGSGRNGKGTLLGAIARALGDYAGELPASALALGQHRHPYELATVPGKRFILSSEAGNSIALHHDRLKQFTGGDRVMADAKYGQPFEFRPVCKIWLAANHRPRVTDDSPAFWARVRFLRFTESFLGREDPDLRHALEHDDDQQRAVLAWLVQGARAYYTWGLPTPAAVREATDEYQADSDPLALWLADAMTVHPNASIAAADAYMAYGAWANRNGVTDRERLGRVEFGRLLKLRYESKKDKYGLTYFGLGRRD